MKRTTGKRALALLCALLMTAALLPAAYATTTENKKSSSEADAIRKEYNDLQQQINDKRQ